MLLCVRMGWLGAGFSGTLHLSRQLGGGAAVVRCTGGRLSWALSADASGAAAVRVRAKAVSCATAVAANRREDGADHYVLGFRVLNSAAPDLSARGMHQ